MIFLKERNQQKHFQNTEKGVLQIVRITCTVSCRDTEGIALLKSQARQNFAAVNIIFTVYYIVMR